MTTFIDADQRFTSNVLSSVEKLRGTFSIQNEAERLFRTVSLKGLTEEITSVLTALPSRLAIIVLLASCGSLLAQNPQVKTLTGSRFPTVIFSSVLWSAEPAYYSIAVDATGTATYQSAPESLERTGVPYTIEFHVSDRTRRTIFNVVRQLDFFRGEIPVQEVSTEKDTAHTLTYRDLPLSTELTYSSSSDSNVQELTSIFEEVSEILEYGRRLAYFHQHDTKKIASELRAVQADADRHFLRELQTIAPIFKSLAADSSLDAETRHAAQTLLETSALTGHSSLP